MARRPRTRRVSTKRQLLDLLDGLEPDLRKHFMDAMNDLRSNASLRPIIEALERGDTEGALRAFNVSDAVFNEFVDAQARAFATSGRLAASRVSRTGQVVFRFDARNMRAESWLTRHSSEFVTNVVNDQRTAIRNALRAAMESGQNPRTSALDIVGRVNRATGRREGGIIGLTSNQEQFVRNARTELAEGRFSQYLSRELRDKRYDRQVLAAMRDGTPLSNDTIRTATNRYSDRLLKMRGDTIARTESLASLNAGQEQAFQQAVDDGLVKEDTVSRTWRTAGDDRVRESHAELEGETVRMDEPFSNGLMFPGDPAGPPEEVINCRCVLEVNVDFLSDLEPPIGEESGPPEQDLVEPETVVPLPPFEPTGDFDLTEEGDHELLATNSLSTPLSAREEAVIADYTENAYFDINRDLRGGMAESDNEIIQTLDDVFARTSLSENITVFRQVDIDTFNLLQGSSEFTDLGFVSTTGDRNILKGSNILRIELPRGSRALPVGNLSEYAATEAEILIARGSRFSVFSDAAGLVLRLLQ